MAWMFAGTELDVSAGLHMHFHMGTLPTAPPVPGGPSAFYPHPAIGPVSTSAQTVHVDHRMPARTGDSFDILVPIHIPLMPAYLPIPLAGLSFVNPALQQKQTLIMGAGLGMHPFGGMKTITIEGKPAAGFLSACTGCFELSPGTSLMLPLVGLDMLLVPTRNPTVFYGPAPANLDLGALLMSVLESLIGPLLGKIDNPLLKKLVENLAETALESIDMFFKAVENGESLESALKQAGSHFAEGAVDAVVGAATDSLLGKLPLPADSMWGGLVQDGIGMAASFGAEQLKGAIRDGIGGGGVGPGAAQAGTEPRTAGQKGGAAEGEKQLGVLGAMLGQLEPLPGAPGQAAPAPPALVLPADGARGGPGSNAEQARGILADLDAMDRAEEAKAAGEKPPPPKPGKLIGLWIPGGSMDAGCAPQAHGAYHLDGKVDIDRGIGWLVNPNPGGTPGGFAMHDHQYQSPHVPRPDRAVVTYHFDAPATVGEIEIDEHTNGVTQIEGFVGDSEGSLGSIGRVTGSLGDRTGSGMLGERTTNIFKFPSPRAGAFFRFVIAKTSLHDGWALYRAFPRDASGKRIELGEGPAGPPPKLGKLIGVWVPGGSMDAGCAPQAHGAYRLDGKVDINRGIGWLVNPNPGGTPGGFAMHDHQYQSPHVPRPDRAVVTYHFDGPTAVGEIEVDEHGNGVTDIEGFVGDSEGSLASIGRVTGSLGQRGFAEHEANIFRFASARAGTYFRFVVTRTSLHDGWALYRAFPRDASGKRIEVLQ